MILRCLSTLVLLTTVFSIETAASPFDTLVTTMKFRGRQVVDFVVCNVGWRCNGRSQTPAVRPHGSANLEGGASALSKPFQQTPVHAAAVAGHSLPDALGGPDFSRSRGASGRPEHRSGLRRDGAVVARHAEKETAASLCGSRSDGRGAGSSLRVLCAEDRSSTAKAAVLTGVAEVGGRGGSGSAVSAVADGATRPVERLREFTRNRRVNYSGGYYKNSVIRGRIRQRAKSQLHAAAARSAKYDSPQGREENVACTRGACRDAAGIPATALPPLIGDQEPIQFGEAEALASRPELQFAYASAASPPARPEVQSVPLETSLPFLQDVSRAAATQDTTTVRGVVEAPDDAVVPGASVVLTAAAADAPLTTKSDDEGEFSFNNVPAGEYVLRVKAPGFKDARLPVTIGLTAMRPIRVRLKISSLTEAVTVTASADPIALADENHTDIQFNEHLMMNVPSKSANPLDVPSLFLAPSAFGNGTSSPQIIVDGVETSALDLPSSSVKSVAVDQNPYSAEFSRPGKARLEVTTKRGVQSRFRGNILAILRNSALDASNAFATVRPLQQRAIGEAELDGPISSTATFVLAGRYNMFNDSSVVFATTPSGTLTENVTTPLRSSHFFFRTDDRLNPLHRLSVLYTIKFRRVDNQGVGGIDLPERATNSFSDGNEVKVLETATLSQSVLNQVRFTYKEERHNTMSVTHSPTLLVRGAFNGGGAQISNRVSETMLDVEDVASIIHGRHDFRFGGGLRPRFISAQDSSNVGGTFTFSCLFPTPIDPLDPLQQPCPFAFSENRPLRFTPNIGNPAVQFHQHEFYTFFQDGIRVRPSFSLTLGLRHEFQSNVSHYHSLAPRLAFAFAPGKGKTVLRGGFGVFYERQPVLMEQQSLLYGGSAIRQVNISNPTYPNPFGPGETSEQATPSVERIDPGIRLPYLMQGSLAIEQKMGRGQNYLTLELTTLRGVGLYRTQDVNFPLPGTGIRPDSNFVNINQFESTASSRSYSAAITYKGHFRKADIVTQYTLSRTLDSASSMNSLPSNNYDLSGEWGRADYDRRHRFNLVLVYSLPAGFRMSGILNAWSGLPYNIITGENPNGNTVVNDRPQGLWRNAGRGSGYTDLDLRLARRWRFSRGDHPHSMEFAVDAFNALNHVNFQNYEGTITSLDFGRANTALPARQLQLSVRFIF